MSIVVSKFDSEMEIELVVNQLFSDEKELLKKIFNRVLAEL